MDRVTATPESKAMPLGRAVRAFVRAGMHLNFASTPGRSNASVRELARAFVGTSPEFDLSATGFHSLLHLLGLLELGRRYIACFFGDNCPVPKPNPLYTRLRERGAQLEFWSVGSYVASLRAGALGLPYGLVTSLSGSDLGRELAEAGRYRELPDPEGGGTPLGLVTPMRPDVTFLHALAGDAQGRVLCSAPFSEGFWGALAARQGVVVTVERWAEPGEIEAHPEAQPIPPHRVLAVCREPMGAHPQPLYVSPSLGGGGYADDFAQYEWWRAAAAEPDRLAPFVEAVLKAEDGAAAYQAFVHRGKSIHPERSEAQPSTPPGGDAGAQATPAERRILRAARRIAERVREAGYPVILAGVGHAFFAARLAQIALEEEGRRVEVLVETGLEGVACGPSAHGFLLSHANMAQAARLSSVEHALGALTCGADNRCLGVIGAAQVDAQGNVNSTRLADGGVLVGSGGANDICSSAAEVVVLSALSRSRLVPRVDHLTSPGRAVRSVVTEACVFARDDTRSPQWTVVSLDAANTPEAVRGQCPWPLTWPSDARQEGLEDDALALLRSLDPDGRHTRRD